MPHKLGIIVPYRNRYRQLRYFKEAIRNYLDSSKIEYHLIIVEQDDAKDFNRGKLLNVGFLKAQEIGCDYVVFHDVDMLPFKVNYNYSDKVLHLANNFVSKEKEFGIHFDTYFGGVTMFPVEIFQHINGYSNKYWGWGFEDDDLFYRCITKGVDMDFKETSTLSSSTAALEFFGQDSYVELSNPINVNRDFSIVVSFDPKKLILDFKKDSDKNVVFTIPGYSFTLCYDSFNRYRLELFDKRGKHYTIFTDVSPRRKTTLTVTYKAKTNTVTLYQDNKIVGKEVLDEKIWNYNKEGKVYLGCSAPDQDQEQQSFYRGYIDVFATFNCALTKKTISAISENRNFGLLSKFENYDNEGNLTCYFDAKFIRHYKLVDLSGNGIEGKINGCAIIPYNIPNKLKITIPHRRKSTFKLLDHASNGYLNGRWASQLTRFNQLKFVNEVSTGYYDTDDDGLGDLDFTVHSEVEVENEIHLVVGI